MKSRKKPIIKNKVLFILIIILIICFILITYGLFKYFYAGSSTKYGDRLEGIENHKIDDTLEKEINALYDEIDAVGGVKVNIQGKLIYVTVDFVKSIKISEAKGFAVKALDAISEENKKYYDIQFILTADTLEEKGSLPTMGYKNANSLNVVWIKS